MIEKHKSNIMLGGVLAGAIALALVYGREPTPAPVSTTPQPAAPPQAMPQEMDPADFGGPTGELPPNHPPINNGDMAQQQPPNDSVHAGMQGTVAPAPVEEEAAALTWKAPASWTLAPNPNQMRLATYKLDATTEMVVARAGGDAAANVTRWTGQFDSSYTLKETHKTVHDLKVTVVEIDGTFKGGMGPTSGDHAGWTMLAAIVEIPKTPNAQAYFFKVVGPSATVHAAEKPFEAMIDGLAPL
jgi:hypothetical protein